MLIHLFFYGSEHIEKQVYNIGDMLIGSIKPLQAPYLKSFLFARRSEKSFSRIEISFQSTHESRKSQSAARARLSQSP